MPPHSPDPGLLHPLGTAGLERALHRQLVDQLTADGPKTRYASYLVAGDDPAAALGRHVETVVFGSAFGNSPQTLASEYGPSEAHSYFTLTVDVEERTVAGAIRIIAGTEKTHLLPSLAGIAGPPWNVPVDEALGRIPATQRPHPARAWDIATVGVLPAYRGRETAGRISLMLYQTTIAAAAAAGCAWWFALLETSVLGSIQRRVGEPFLRYPRIDPGPFLGAPSTVPVWADVHTWLRRLHQQHPDLYRTLALQERSDAQHTPAQLRTLPAV